jgi:futalosine hydrolase
MTGRGPRLLVVVAVAAEAEALAPAGLGEIVVAGIGRTNAAAATTEALLQRGPFDAAVSVGIAGALPGSDLAIGDAVIATESVYFEEGIETPAGFLDSIGLGFPLGPFPGNRIPGDAAMRSRLQGLGRFAPIATVATCSGTDRLAIEVASRTGAVAEAMEGAAVLHAAGRLGVAALEVRVVSNTTGDRPRQRWDLPRGLASLRAVGLGLASRLRSA